MNEILTRTVCIKNRKKNTENLALNIKPITVMPRMKYSAHITLLGEILYC